MAYIIQIQSCFIYGQRIPLWVLRFLRRERFIQFHDPGGIRDGADGREFNFISQRHRTENVEGRVIAMNMDYELPKHNASDKEIRDIFRFAKVIAVVGLSRHHEAPSYKVASYLQEHGFRIIPVHPKAKEILNETVYSRLEDAPEKIDVVNVFRKAEDVPTIVESAIAIEAQVIWLQERIVHNIAAARARKAGLTVVMDKCMMKEHKKYEIDISL